MTRLYGFELRNPLMLGTARYPSPGTLLEAFRASGAEIATVSLRRISDDSGKFHEMIRSLGVAVLPNTAGCHSVKEAVTTAHMAREIYGTPWIKLEVIGHAGTLQPDGAGTLEAARILAHEGFQVFPYCTEDLVIAGRLLEAGCEVLMPWGAPIGTGLGLVNPHGLLTLRQEFPEVPMIVDAGIGLPSHAARAMELGFDAVLLNSAVAGSGDPVTMARAMANAVEAGLLARKAGPMARRAKAQSASPLESMAALA